MGLRPGRWPVRQNDRRSAGGHVGPPLRCRHSQCRRCALVLLEQGSGAFHELLQAAHEPGRDGAVDDLMVYREAYGDNLANHDLAVSHHRLVGGLATPRIADWPALRIGVKPSTEPRTLMVKVPPRTSSGPSEPVLARSARSVVSLAISAMLFSSARARLERPGPRAEIPPHQHSLRRT